MATLDTSMYRNPLRSVADFETEYGQADLQKQALLKNKLMLDSEIRARDEAEALKGVVKGFGPDVQANAALIRSKTGNLDASQKYLKNAADIAKEQAQAEKTAQESRALKMQGHRDALNLTVHAPQDLANWITVVYKDFPELEQQAPLEKVVATILNSTPEQFQALKFGMAQQAKDAIENDRKERELKQTITNAEAMRAAAVARDAETGRHNLASEANVVRGQNITREAVLGGGSVQVGPDGQMYVVPTKGAISGKPIVGSPVVNAAGEPLVKPPKATPMSVTLQKELIESDEVAEASRAANEALETALKFNEDSYSGYFAKARAVARSNVPGKNSKEADATIAMDNLITGQALTSLKATFGGQPTEGERKVLLDIQALPDKTPDQRKEIIGRARAAAQRREKMAKAKADAIRSGKFLTEGAPEVPTDSTPTTPVQTTPPVSALKEGAVTTFRNGQKWTLQGGKPVKVE